MISLYKILYENIQDKYIEQSWIPQYKDWEHIILFINEYNNPKKLLEKIKDKDKLIRYYIIASVLEWNHGMFLFHDYLKNKFNIPIKTLRLIDSNILEENIIQIPEDYQYLINELKQYDKKGGIATLNQNSLFGKFLYDKVLFKTLKNIHEIERFSFYDYDYGPLGDKIIKLFLKNGSVTFIGISVVQNKYSVYSKYSKFNNIPSYSLKTYIEMAVEPYFKNKIVEDQPIFLS